MLKPVVFSVVAVVAWGALAAGDGTTFAVADRVLTVTVPAGVTNGSDYASLVADNDVTNVVLRGPGVGHGVGSLVAVPLAGYSGDFTLRDAAQLLVKNACDLGKSYEAAAPGTGTVRIENGSGVTQLPQAAGYIAAGKTIELEGKGPFGRGVLTTQAETKYGTSPERVVSGSVIRLTGDATFYMSGSRIYFSCYALTDLCGHTLTYARAAAYQQGYVCGATFTNSVPTPAQVKFSGSETKYYFQSAASSWTGGASNRVSLAHGARYYVTQPQSGDWTLVLGGNSAYEGSNATKGRGYYANAWGTPVEIAGSFKFTNLEDKKVGYASTFTGPIGGTNAAAVVTLDRGHVVNVFSKTNTFAGSWKLVGGTGSVYRTTLEFHRDSVFSGNAVTISDSDLFLDAETRFDLPTVTVTDGDCALCGGAAGSTVAAVVKRGTGLLTLSTGALVRELRVEDGRLTTDGATVTADAFRCGGRWWPAGDYTSANCDGIVGAGTVHVRGLVGNGASADGELAIVVDAATFADDLPLRSGDGRTVVLPSRGSVTLTGWDPDDACLDRPFVIAEGDSFVMPDSFDGWWLRPDAGDRRPVFSVEDGKLVMRIVRTAFVTRAAGGAAEFSGLSGFTLTPIVYYGSSWSDHTCVLSTTFDVKKPFADDGTVPFTMAMPDGNVFTGSFEAAQLPEGKVRLRWTLVPARDCTVMRFGVRAFLPRLEFDGGRLTWGATDANLPLASEATKSVTSAAFRDASGVLRLQTEFPVVTYVDVHAPSGDGRQSIEFGPTARRLTGGTAYETDLTLSCAVPVVLDPSDGLVISSGSNWRPTAPVVQTAPGSALDFSQLRGTDAPAGAHGRVVRCGDHFEFAGLPGVKQRFYGVNICYGANVPSEAKAAEIAADLARIGYNALRIHHYETDLVAADATGAYVTLDPDKMHRFDALVAAAVGNGLYLTTDLYVSRKPTWRALGCDLDGAADFKKLVYVSKAARDNLKAFTRAFFLHRNAFTGRTLAEEPALMGVAMVNEGVPNATPAELVRDCPGWAEAWSAWLTVKKTEDPATFGGIPDAVPASFGELPGGPVFERFFAELQADLDDDLMTFMREELGCLAPLTNMNGLRYSAALQTVKAASYDYADNHFYVDHPSWLATAWSLPSKYGNSNVIKGTSRGVASVATMRMLDRPFTITEYNHTAPGRFRANGALIEGALAALQDWSGVYRFAWSHDTPGIEDPTCKGIENFNASGDPMMALSDRLFTSLFLRGDLAPLARTYAQAIPPGVAASGDVSAVKSLNGYSELWRAWYAKVGFVIADAVPAGALSAGTWPASLTRTTAEVRSDLGLADPVQGVLPIAGDGKVRIDGDAGSLAVDAGASSAVFGENGLLTAGPLSVNLGSSAATVFAIALDGRRIGKSKRLLLAHLTDIQNSGITYFDHNRTMLSKWGTLPHLMRDAQAAVSLTVGPGAFDVYVLDADGRRRHLVPSTKTGNVLHFLADVGRDADATSYLYEIVRLKSVLLKFQ